jgi:hypothetical protein
MGCKFTYFYRVTVVEVVYMNTVTLQQIVIVLVAVLVALGALKFIKGVIKFLVVLAAIGAIIYYTM